MFTRDWLKRPIAHRGLHDSAKGVIENTASAFAAALAGNYAIECDLQEAACGEPMVFHDSTLDRLTTGAGPVRQFDSTVLKAVRFKAASDRMQTLSELLEQVNGRTPLFIEVKSARHAGGRDQAARFCARIAKALAAYRGPAAVMAFDPAIATRFHVAAPHVPRGLVSCRHRSADWPHLCARDRLARTQLLPGIVARPHFIAYNLHSLPAAGPWVARNLFQCPMIVWTIRSETEAAQAKTRADAMIFEGFLA
jgi:glycerophosphoryl diester phosphodiesterase